MNEYKGYIFDLDDTLYCEHDYVKSGFWAVSNAISIVSKRNSEQIFTLIIEEWEKNGRGRIFNSVCDKLGIEMDVSKLVQIYRNHKPQIKPYSDSLQLIKNLKGKNKKLGIITDGNSIMQWRKIEALQIKEFFDCIVVTDDLGPAFWKPSDIPYIKMVECLNLSFTECVYIGDNPHKDFITARKLGMDSIRIVRPIGDHMKTVLSEKYEAECVINSLEALIIND